jgi:hypothetical protein
MPKLPPNSEPLNVRLPTINLSASQMARLRQAAYDQHSTVSEIVRMSIEEWLEKEEK